MDYEFYDHAIEKLKQTKEYVQHAHDIAEYKHDSYGESHRDETQFEIMNSTEALLAEITKIIDKFENT